MVFQSGHECHRLARSWRTAEDERLLVLQPMSEDGLVSYCIDSLNDLGCILNILFGDFLLFESLLPKDPTCINWIDCVI